MGEFCHYSNTFTLTTLNDGTHTKATADAETVLDIPELTYESYPVGMIFASLQYPIVVWDEYNYNNNLLQQQKLTQQQGSPQSQRQQQPPPSLQPDQSELLNNMDPARLP
jgi:hypothetical protein